MRRASVTTRGEQACDFGGCRSSQSHPIAQGDEGMHRAERGSMRHNYDTIESRPMRRDLIAGLARPERILMDEGATYSSTPYQGDVVDQTRSDGLLARRCDSVCHGVTYYGQAGLRDVPCRPQQERDNGRRQQHRHRPATEQAWATAGTAATSSHFPSDTRPSHEPTLTKGGKYCNVSQQRVKPTRTLGLGIGRTFYAFSIIV